MTLTPTAAVNLASVLPSDQLAYSPFSISSAMCMTSLAAAGETYNEIISSLNCDHDTNQALMEGLLQSSVEIANAMFPLEGVSLKESFVNQALSIYDTQIIPMNYVQDAESARNYINAFVSNKTEDAIQNILPPNSLDHLTRNVIVNTIFLNMSWANPFPRASTQEGEFKMLSGENTQVTYMRKSGMSSYEWIDYGDGIVGLKLPLEDYKFSVEFVKPSTPTEEGLKQAENRLLSRSGESKRDIFNDVRIPKFKVESSLQLVDPMKKMGIVKAFSESEADFSNMFEEPFDLFISNIFHKAMVSMNEDGVAAAAATAITVSTTSLPWSENPKSFILDTPFMATINYEEHPLFVVRVLHPEFEE